MKTLLWQEIVETMKQHRGIDHAIDGRELCIRLIGAWTPGNKGRLNAAVNQARAAGYPIAGLRGFGKSGYFWIETEAELNLYVRDLELLIARTRESIVNIRESFAYEEIAA